MAKWDEGSEEWTSSTHRLDMHPVTEEPKKAPLYTRGKLVGLMLSTVLLVYALFSGDVPLFFILLSFILFLLRPLAEKFVGPWLSNAMKGFAAALGFGALALAFI